MYSIPTLFRSLVVALELCFSFIHVYSVAHSHSLILSLRLTNFVCSSAHFFSSLSLIRRPFVTSIRIVWMHCCLRHGRVYFTCITCTCTCTQRWVRHLSHIFCFFFFFYESIHFYSWILFFYVTLIKKVSYYWCPHRRWKYFQSQLERLSHSIIAQIFTNLIRTSLLDSFAVCFVVLYAWIMLDLLISQYNQRKYYIVVSEHTVFCFCIVLLFHFRCVCLCEAHSTTVFMLISRLPCTVRQHNNITDVADYEFLIWQTHTYVTM